MTRLVAATFVCIILLEGSSHAEIWLSQSTAPGVIVEDTGTEEDALFKAGLRRDDLVKTWERLSDVSSVPEGTQGAFLSPFDWIFVQTEFAAGGLILTGYRKDEPKTWKVDPGVWSAKGRPVMTNDATEIYLQAISAIKNGGSLDSLEYFKKLEAIVEDEDLLSWIMYRFGDEFASRNAWGDAQDQYMLALEYAEKPFARITIYKSMGKISRQQSDYTNARVQFKAALELSRANWSRSLITADAESKLGSIDFLLGDLPAAEQRFKSSLALRQEIAPGSLDVASGLNNMGLVAYEYGRYQEANGYYAEALEIYKRLAPGSLSMSSVLNNLGVVARMQGKLEEAENYYNSDLEILQEVAPDSLQVASSYNNLGNIALDRYDLERAEQYHKRSLYISEKLAPGGLGIADSYLNLGLVASSRSDLASADIFYRKALAIQKLLTPGSDSVATTYNNLGVTAAERGDFEAAGAYHEKALAIWSKIKPNSSDLAMSLNNLGVVAAEIGDYSAAEEYHNKALDLRRSIDAHSSDVAVSLHNLGDLALDKGELRRAESRLKEALEIRKRLIPESFNIATTYNKLGAVARARGDLGKAEEFYRRGLSIAEVLAPNSKMLAHTLHALGRIFRDGHEFERAELLMARAVNTLEQQAGRLGGSHLSNGRFRAQNKAIYHEYIELLAELNKYEESFHSLERYRARALLDSLAERDLVFSTDLPEEVDLQRRRLAFRYDQALYLMQSEPERSKELSDIMQESLREREALIARVRSENPRLAALQYPQSIGVSDAQSIIEPDITILSYSVGETRTHLFRIDSREFEVYPIAIGRAELDNIVDSFLSKIGREKNRQSPLFDGLEGDAAFLFDLLVQPAAASIGNSGRVVIVPDESLHKLPFGALMRKVGKDGIADNGLQYFVEWKPLSLVLSGSLYAQLVKSRSPAIRERNLVTAFGDPVFTRRDDDRDNDAGSLDTNLRTAAMNGMYDLDPLSYSRNEVFEIARLYDHVQLFMGQAATEENAKTVIGNVDFVHFASHVLIDDRAPLNSAVILTINWNSEPGADNGLLQAWEVFESVRTDADLVVLSACKSALGEPQGGEGLIGITRAFQYAGARTVAASLWMVADGATSELMIRFYHHLRDGLPKDEALRAAQLELIRGPIEVKNADGETIQIDASAPYYWAAFQIYGDWQ